MSLPVGSSASELHSSAHACAVPVQSPNSNESLAMKERDEAALQHVIAIRKGSASSLDSASAVHFHRARDESPPTDEQQMEQREADDRVRNLSPVATHSEELLFDVDDEAGRAHSAPAARDAGSSAATAPGSLFNSLFASPMTMNDFLANSRFSVTEESAPAVASSVRGSARSSFSSSAAYPHQLHTNSRNATGLRAHHHHQPQPTHRKFVFPSVTKSMPNSADATAANTPQTRGGEEEAKEQLKPQDEEDKGARTIIVPTAGAAAVAPPVEVIQERSSIIPSIAVAVFGGGIYGSAAATN